MNKKTEKIVTSLITFLIIVQSTIGINANVISNNQEETPIKEVTENESSDETNTDTFVVEEGTSETNQKPDDIDENESEQKPEEIQSSEDAKTEEHLGNEPNKELIDTPMIVQNSIDGFKDLKTGEVISPNRITYENPIMALSNHTISFGAGTGYYSRVTAADGVHMVYNANQPIIYVDGEVAFCVEPGIEAQEGGGYVPSAYEQHELAIIVYEGWTMSDHSAEAYLATQFMIWEYLGATIESNFSSYTSFKADIQYKVDHHNDKPSFQNGNYELNVGESITIHDTNEVLSKFHITSTDGLDVSINGNDLIITGTADAKDNAVIGLDKIAQECIGTSLIYQKAGSQDIVKFMLKDPLQAWLSVKVNKQGTITINKSDAETGSISQGDALLTGWTFGIYTDAAKTNKVDTLTSTSLNSVTSKLLDFATYYVFEESAPPGYIIDPAPHVVELTPDNKDITLTVSNQVIKGRIQLHKIVDQPIHKSNLKALGESEIKQPLKDVTFDFYLKSTGQKAATVITDKNGYLITPLLPYGTYTVVEHAVEGYDTLPPFDVTISQNNKTYNYYIENAALTSRLQIIKTDAETGKQIPVSGIQFKIKDPAGNYVKQKLWYPVPIEIDTFETADDGTVTLPETLVYGKDYTIEEVSGSVPEGYLLNLEGVKFDVEGTDMIVIKFANTPVKGQIEIEKTGEVFKGYDFRNTEFGIINEPIFENSLLADVEYDIIARENIVTLDGTLWYEEGEVVETLTTDGINKTLSSLLPLGKYTLKEKSTMPGYVIDEKEYDIDLLYADEVTPIIIHTESKWNDKQRGSISFHKIMEDSHFVENPLQSVSYGLFNAEPLIIAGNQELPADSLISVVQPDKDGNMSFLIDFEGKYYVQELTTNESYVLDSIKHYFEFHYLDENASLTELSFDSGISRFENKLKTGSFEIIKTSNEPYPFIPNVEDIQDYLSSLKNENSTVNADQKFYLEGVEFEVALDKEFKEIVQTGTTDKNGYLKFSGLELGTYYWRESKCLDGFVLDTTIHKIEIKETESTGTIELENEVRRSSIEIYKEDAFTHRKLPNAEFTLFSDQECTQPLVKAISGKDGVARFENLLNQTVYAKETNAPEGFLLSDEVVKIVIDSNEPPKAYKIVYYNTMLPSFSIPQTGTGAGLYLILAIFIATGGLLVIMESKRRIKNGK